MTDKMNKTTVLLITAFIALIIGVSLIGVIGTEEQKITQLTQINDESINIASGWLNATHVNITHPFSTSKAYNGNWKSQDTDCNMVARAYGNSTHDLTVTTDYALSTSGVITLGATQQASARLLVIRAANNLTQLDYNYCADDYTSEGWTRNVLNVVIGMFAIALMLVAVGIFYSVLKEEGILNI